MNQKSVPKCLPFGMQHHKDIIQVTSTCDVDVNKKFFYVETGGK
jgi:hypothetical protein